MTKKVCIFTRSLQKGGAEKQSLLLVKALKNHFKTHLVVLYGDESIDDEYKDFLLKTEINPILLKGNLFQKFLGFLHFLRINKINTLLCFLYSTNVVGSIAGKLCKVKHIIGGARSSVYPNVTKLLVQKFLHNHVLDYTIINNKRGLENLTKKGFNSKKFIYIPNGIEINTAIAKEKNNKIINILSVGRFVEEKDYKTAIKAIACLKNIVASGTDYQYTIVGYGKLENEIRSLITDEGLDKLVKIVINPENVEKYYLEADIYLLTSIFEGFPNTIMEAMTYSLPIVATKVGDMDQLVKDNQNGFIVEVGDFESIADKLSLLINSPDKRNDMGKAGYMLLKNNFSFETFEEQYFKFIEQLH